MDSGITTQTILEPNKKLLRKHKKESLRQIWLPFIITIILVIALCVLAVLLTTRDHAAFTVKWGSISLIYMIIPTLIAGLILLAVIAALIYGIVYLIQNLPTAFRTLEMYSEQLRDGVSRLMKMLTKPVIQLNAIFAQIEMALRKLGFRK